jgi:hypothetical protein
MSGGRAAMGALAALLIGAGGSCGIFDFDVDLAHQTFTLDFGQQTGTMPAVACDGGGNAVCDNAASFNFDASSTAGTPSQVDVALGCDTSSAQCYA